MPVYVMALFLQMSLPQCCIRKERSRDLLKSTVICTCWCIPDTNIWLDILFDDKNIRHLAGYLATQCNLYVLFNLNNIIYYWSCIFWSDTNNLKGWWLSDSTMLSITYAQLPYLFSRIFLSTKGFLRIIQDAQLELIYIFTLAYWYLLYLKSRVRIYYGNEVNGSKLVCIGICIYECKVAWSKFLGSWESLWNYSSRW